jgi:hypothetical protein
MAVLWVVAPFRLYEFTDVSEALAASIIKATSDELKAGKLLHDLTTQKTAIFKLSAVKYHAPCNT